MYRPKSRSEQGALWIPTHELPRSSAHSFYGRLHHHLEKIGFGDNLREACRPFYDDSGNGRPGVDPEVFFRMLMVGFFEGLPSERAIAARCADSIEIRAFLGYSLTDRTPDHSTICRFRQRIPEEVFYSVFELIVKALKKSRLVRGRHLGVDSSVVEANASLASLVNRLTQEEYDAYIRRLAQEEGVDPKDDAAVRRFDKHRKGRKTSNDEWKNPHDEDARVGRTKRGETRMLYKNEHVVDLETGAILDAKIRHGDDGDATDLFTRILEAEERINRSLEQEPWETAVETVTADKGYYATDEITALQNAGVETLIPAPKCERNLNKLHWKKARAVIRAEAMTSCREGNFFMRRRAHLVERSFAHVLEAGGLRRTTLRGRTNVNKRYVIGALTYNLSLLMRSIYGVGTPRQAMSAAFAALFALIWSLVNHSRRSLKTFGDKAINYLRITISNAAPGTTTERMIAIRAKSTAS